MIFKSLNVQTFLKSLYQFSDTQCAEDEKKKKNFKHLTITTLKLKQYCFVEILICFILKSVNNICLFK